MTKKVKFVVTVIWLITLFIMGTAMYHIGYDEGHYDSVKLYKPHMESMLYENRKRCSELEEQLAERINTEKQLRKMLLEETLKGGESLSES